MTEPSPIPRKVLVGGILVVGAAIGAIVLAVRQPHDESPRVADSASGSQEPVATTPTFRLEPTPPSAPPRPTTAPPAPSAGIIDLGPAMLEAKKLDDVRTKLAANDPKGALEALESYERVVRGPGALQHEATLMKIQALSQVGRKTDALALAMSARDDPAWSGDRDRLEAVTSDAGF